MGTNDGVVGVTQRLCETERRRSSRSVVKLLIVMRWSADRRRTGHELAENAGRR